MAAALFDDSIDGQVFETRILGKRFAVGCFTDAGRTGNDDVWIFPCHIAQAPRSLEPVDGNHV